VPTEFRNFFAFDLSGLTEEDVVIGAEFNVYSANIVTSDPFETIQLVDVTTSVDDVVAGGSNRFDIFDDLGTGSVYATRDVLATERWAMIDFDLNAAAVAAINAARGQGFSLPAQRAVDSIEPYYDVNCDGFVSPIDALQVIDLLTATADRDAARSVLERDPEVIVSETVKPVLAAQPLERLLHLHSSGGPLSKPAPEPPAGGPGVGKLATGMAVPGMSDIWDSPDRDWLREGLGPDISTLAAELVARCAADADPSQLDLRFKRRPR